MSAYKAIHGPYDWDWFPLAPPGCKAMIYKAPELCCSWASHGTDAWYVGLSMDHYRCNHFFVPEMWACPVSGSVELLPQNCQVPFLMWNEHLQKVIDKLVTTLHELPPEKCPHVISLVQDKLSTHTTIDNTRTLMHPTHNWLLPPADIHWAPYIPPPEQRVEQRVNTSDKQRMEHFTKIPVLMRITNAPYHGRS
jgi:hypothetical protein